MVALRIDMSLIDEEVFKIIAGKRDEWGFSDITIEQIATAARCHWNTAWRATRRLESAKRIRKINRGGTRLGVRYQVFDDQSRAVERHHFIGG